MILLRLLPAALLLFGLSASATCYEQAAAPYAHLGMTPRLLQAMATTESSGNPRAMNMSHIKRTGSYDIGLMQINSRWLPTLAKFGITERDLYEPCQNVIVGAWILAPLLQQYGPGWEAVGAYNATCSTLKGADCTAARNKYAWSVYHSATGARAPVDPIAHEPPHPPRIRHITLAASTDPAGTN